MWAVRAEPGLQIESKHLCVSRPSRTVAHIGNGLEAVPRRPLPVWRLQAAHGLGQGFQGGAVGGEGVRVGVLFVVGVGDVVGVTGGGQKAGDCGGGRDGLADLGRQGELEGAVDGRGAAADIVFDHGVRMLPVRGEPRGICRHGRRARRDLPSRPPGLPIMATRRGAIFFWIVSVVSQAKGVLPLEVSEGDLWR